MLSASSKNTIQDLVKDLQMIIYDSNGEKDNQKSDNDSKKNNDDLVSNFSNETNDKRNLRNQIKSNIKNMFKAVKEKPEEEKIKVLNSIKTSNNYEKSKKETSTHIKNHEITIDKMKKLVEGSKKKLPNLKKEILSI